MESSRTKKVRVYNKRLTNRYYYFYAYQDNGSSIWKGATLFCAPRTIFKLDNLNCTSEEYAHYREIDVGNNKTHVISLTEDNIAPGRDLKDIISIERH